MIFHKCLISVCLHTNLCVFFKAEQGSEEGCNSTQRDERQARRVYVEQVEGCTPITTYRYDIPKELPWYSGDQQLTLESWISHYNKLQHDLSSLELPPERKQSLEIALQSLQKLIEV